MIWQFWIDVGGTFTDCIGVDPLGNTFQHKTLSSGVVNGEANGQSSPSLIVDPARRSDPDGFWNGSTLTILDDSGQPGWSAVVSRSESGSGRLHVALGDNGLPAWTRSVRDGSGHDAEMPDLAGRRYLLNPGFPAPVLAIRWMLKLHPQQTCPQVLVRFGTTRGTNALLTRTGARTVLITTRGFGDTPLIGNQTRPELFARVITKPAPLFERVVEVTERMDAGGQVLHPFMSVPSEEPVERRTDVRPTEHDPLIAADAAMLLQILRQLKAEGLESAAICFLNAYANDRHECVAEDVARRAGFREISRSSEVAPLVRMGPRCDTTLLDAALNPILREYLQSIQAQLPHSDIQVMTSAGGLVSASRFRGRDCVLSGPAGGIVGFSAAARLEGFDRAIGFDMGGTSTDVARFDGQYEYEQETSKAGVRIMTPVLAIETVAAGGGSVCGFDGSRLFVGPHSAGADPGPAGYGRGGPLTVTDLNVFLGRILPAHFPLALDQAAVARRLDELRSSMLLAGVGRDTMTREELAEGLLQIADDNMVHAIRRVSVARGCDPAEYLLVSFGGAGGQHACRVAASLGIRRILVPPFAGTLSAWGMGQADLRAHRQLNVLQPLSRETFEALQPELRRLTEETRHELLQQGISPNRIDDPIFRFELRYSGTDPGLSLTGATADELRQRFEELHQQQFGYVRSGRSVQIVSVLTEAIGRNLLRTAARHEPEKSSGAFVRELPDTSRTATADPSSDHHRTPGRPTQPVVDQWAETWFAGTLCRTPVMQLQSLSLTDCVAGPAIICEPGSTIWLEPGWTASRTRNGGLLLEHGTSVDSPQSADGHTDTQRTPATVGDQEKSRSAERRLSAEAADPVLLEIFGNQLMSIAEQMGEMLRRTAISTNIRERLDFSCALFDAEGRLIVNAPHVPVHLGAMSETVQAVISDHPDMVPGDVFVTNDPYRGGSHLPDVTVITPIFCGLDPQRDSAHRRPQFFAANRAHHAEIGGIQPGSLPPFSRTLAEEGVLIRSRRLVAAGQSREDDIRSLLTNAPYPSRAVNDNLADLAAQVAANACGARLLQAQVRRHSLQTIHDSMREIRRASSQRIARALRLLQGNEWKFEDRLDDGTPICVNIQRCGETAVIDFAGTGAVHPGNLNANRAITTAAILYALRCLLDEQIPLNSGVLEPIRILIPAGLLNPEPGPTAESTPAIVGGNVETSQRIVDVLFGALNLAAASQGTMNNLTFGSHSFGYYETIGGGSGAVDGANGADAVHTHMTNTRLTDPEILEQRYPVRVHHFSIRRGSGGSGRFRGGNGMIREIEFLESVRVSILSQRRSTAPYGKQGGGAGQPGRNLLLLPEANEWTDVGGAFSASVLAGTRFRIETPGGGGWGSPMEEES